MEYEITKRVMFCAAHSIMGAGKCENKHGHNWEATITVQSNVVDERGFVADVADIKKAAFQYDHDDLDKYFTYASTENVAQKIAEDVLHVVLESQGPVEDRWIKVEVDLVETENNSAVARVDYGFDIR